jgi:hypothetical protein
MISIVDIANARCAQRRRLIAKRRIVVMVRQIAALKRDRAALIERQKQSDAALGMAWWNALTARQRKRWMQLAGDTGRASDAWDAFKSQSRGEAAS